METEPFLLSHSLQQAAVRVPDQEAVVLGSDSITYRELVDRAARFAGYLVSQGLERGDRVIVDAVKSIDAVVAIHGAQWAGGVAVPVDPNAPHDFLAEVVNDAQPGAIVTDERTAPAAADLDVPVRVGGSDPDRSGVASWAEVWSAEPIPIVPRLGGDPAYILYTSGSTGRPKGIVHSHRSGLRYAQLAAETYGLSPRDRMANVAPFHFDQSTFELYAGPVANATVVLIPEVLLRFPAEVAKLVAESGITVWYSVPTVLVQMLERGALERHDLGRLRWVLFGGEVFPSDALAALMRLVEGARFSNVYGPTEVNQCTHHHLEDPPGPGETVPIGRPWGDTEVRLADDLGSVVSGPGRGILEVRTATMMVGYWRRPDLTAASVVTEVDGHGLDTRWYRTGDLVERDEAGRLTFLGRTDRQVKVRGHRIELEGIEAALSGMPGVVRSAVVVARRQPSDILVGVVEGSGVDPAAVLSELRRVLPPQSVPTELRVVPDLPRTRSGKIDARQVELMVNCEQEGPVHDESDTNA